uniref:Uncharacterized protein n=1 Tax=Rhabditophanes sp. KR3021 TaxID=114890 RepID=A0AC35U0N3_9BILA
MLNYATNAPEYLIIVQHLKTLAYEARPNYTLIYDQFNAALKRLNTSFLGPMHWEDDAEIEEELTRLKREFKVESHLKNYQLLYKLYPVFNPKHFVQF